MLDDFAKNLCLMKRCKKAYTVIFYCFLVGGLLLVIYSFTSMTGLSWDWLAVAGGVDPLSPISFVMIGVSIVLAPLSFFFAYRGSQKQNDLSVILLMMLNAAALLLIIVLQRHHFFNRLMIGFWVFMIYTVGALILGAFNMKTNLTYHYLEEQPGFPLFNERAEEQRYNKIQRGIKDQFQQEMERRMKTAADSMGDLGTASGQLEKYVPEHKPSDMDSI